MPALPLTCANCSKEFVRRKYSISNNSYCSRSCAAKTNNSRFPKHPGIKKTCIVCGKNFVSQEKYCSPTCQYKGLTITKEDILSYIRDFYKKNGRIPLKREFKHPRAARERFGTWNNAIFAAGLTPNPVLFANKWLARDGHKCDSLAEKIIDDWLYQQNIPHKRTVPYPGNNKLSVDFVVENYWIEFFGLFGENIRYDELRKMKLKLVKEYKLEFIGIYPADLFPHNNLPKVLKLFVK